MASAREQADRKRERSKAEARRVAARKTRERERERKAAAAKKRAKEEADRRAAILAATEKKGRDLAMKRVAKTPVVMERSKWIGRRPTGGPLPETTIPLTSQRGQAGLTRVGRNLFGMNPPPAEGEATLEARAVRQKLLNQQQLRAHLVNIRKEGREKGLNPKQIQIRVDAEIKKNQLRTDVDTANWPIRAAGKIRDIHAKAAAATRRPSMRFKKGGAVKSSRKKSIDGPIVRKGHTRAPHK